MSVTFSGRHEAIEWLDEMMAILGKMVGRLAKLGPARPDTSPLRMVMGKQVQHDILAVVDSVLSAAPAFAGLGLAETFADVTDEFFREHKITPAGAAKAPGRYTRDRRRRTMGTGNPQTGAHMEPAVAVGDARMGVEKLRALVAEYQRIGDPDEGEPLVMKMGRNAILYNIKMCSKGLWNIHDYLATSAAGCSEFHAILDGFISEMSLRPGSLLRDIVASETDADSGNSYSH